MKASALQLCGNFHILQVHITANPKKGDHLINYSVIGIEADCHTQANVFVQSLDIFSHNIFI